MGQKRYPGALPFNKQQKNIFYGRVKDITQLKTLIQVEKQVLLYSRSGLGKTSLLEAGVIPELPNNYVPLSVRFYAFDKEQKDQVSPVDRVIDTLNKIIPSIENLESTLLDKIIGKEEKHKTLWYHFKNLQFQEDANEKKKEKNIYLLVFDQFEELFTYPQDQVNEFKNQYYELTRHTIPNNFINLISDQNLSEDLEFENKFIARLYQKMGIKTVFAIRSDRLALLNRLSDKIVDIQKVHKVLKPLDSQQARDAIEKPARNKGEGFDTRPFKYDEKAVDKIISDLTVSEDKHLETTQLQIVCQRIEDIAAKKYEKERNGKEVVIYEEDVPDLSNIFDKFYDDSITKLEKDEQDKAKRFIEGQLIKNEVRISLDVEACKGAVSEKTLETLVNAHLLRAERNTMERVSYELSHDTLIQSVLDSRKKHEADKARIEAEEKRKEEIKQAEEKSLEELKKLREEQERKEEINRLKAEQKRKEEIQALKAEQKQKEEIQKLKEEQRIKELEKEQNRKEEEQKRRDKDREKEKQEQNRRFRIIVTGAIIAGVFGIAAIILALFAYSKTLEAREQKANADTARMKADSSLIRLSLTQFDKSFDEAKVLQASAKFEVAIIKYNEALDFITVAENSIDNIDSENKMDFSKKNSSADEKIIQCIEKLKDTAKYHQLLDSAKILFNPNKEYFKTLVVYDSALKMNFYNFQVLELMNKVAKEALRVYDKDIKDFDEFEGSLEFLSEANANRKKILKRLKKIKKQKDKEENKIE